jgi:hypothetical protein
MNDIQRKYGLYLKLIDENRSFGTVVITNSQEIDKQS